MMGSFSVTQKPFLAFQDWLRFGKFSGFTAVDGINKSGVPIMLVHGRNDDVVSATGAGTVSHISEITNPNLVVFWRETPGQDGHNSLFMSQTAVEYADEINAKYDSLQTAYGEEIPEDVLDAYYAEIDKHKTAELDGEYVETVLSFFNSNV